MAQIRSHFEAIAKELSQAIDDFEVEVKDFGGIDFEQYQQILSSGRASKTWDYAIRFRFDDTHLRFVFWYGAHHGDGWDTVVLDREPVLLVSIESENNYQLLDNMGEAHVSLREVGLKSGKFVRIRRVPTDNRRVFDEDIDAFDLVKTFYTEVITNKLGIQ